MLSIGIGEIQKNTSIFTNLTEVIQIIDKRKKLSLAMVYPVRNHSVINSLAGKYKDQVKKTSLTMQQIKEKAMMESMGEKYDLSY
ncbi:MAG: hypothetical protein U9N02_03745 [Campylobacterota bacterium]|nr:hypothetical protein [Campylobacterota bacterium]